MALDADGRFLALRVDILGNLGANLTMFAPYIPWLGATMATGPYDIGALYARCRGVYTHTVPVDAYRGAGRPEAAYVLERLVDLCARDARRHARGTARAQFHPARSDAVSHPYGPRLRCRRVRRRHARLSQEGRPCGLCRAGRSNREQRGKIRGFGISSYIECTAWNDGEEGSVTLEKDGDFTVLIGTQSNGQGHETAYAQVVAQHLDVPLERVKVVQGDTDRIATGFGTGASRSIPVGAVMVTRASQTLAASLKELAADKLEAAVADLEIDDGKVRIAGTDRAISYAEIAALPGATAAKLTAVESFTPSSATYPNGTHACEVEIDPETGETSDRPLHRRRRLRLHPEPAAAGRPGPRRHRAGQRARR